jgi:hypothetical protein
VSLVEFEGLHYEGTSLTDIYATKLPSALPSVNLDGLANDEWPQQKLRYSRAGSIQARATDSLRIFLGSSLLDCADHETVDYQEVWNDSNDSRLDVASLRIPDRVCSDLSQKVEDVTSKDGVQFSQFSEYYLESLEAEFFNILTTSGKPMIAWKDFENYDPDAEYSEDVVTPILRIIYTTFPTLADIRKKKERPDSEDYGEQASIRGVVNLVISEDHDGSIDRQAIAIDEMSGTMIYLVDDNLYCSRY